MSCSGRGRRKRWGLAAELSVGRTRAGVEMDERGKGQGSPLTAKDVLHRYQDEDLPAFCGMTLDDVNRRGTFGEYPLDVAATRGDPAEVLALIQGGAHINAHGELGYTALHEAVGQGHIEIVRLLLQHGASCNERNDYGMTPLDIARMRGRHDIVALLAGVTRDPADRT